MFIELKTDRQGSSVRIGGLDGSEPVNRQNLPPWMNTGDAAALAKDAGYTVSGQWTRTKNGVLKVFTNYNVTRTADKN